MKDKDNSDEFCDKLGLALLLGGVVEVICVVVTFLIGWAIGGWSFALKSNDLFRWIFGLLPAAGLAWLLWAPSKRSLKK